MAFILSPKVVLISVAVMFTVLGLRASLPLATTHLPLIWNLLLLCFKPPYLYLILNAIIISILASSRFNHSPPSDPTPPPVPDYHIKSPPQFPQNDIAEPTPAPALEVKAVVVNGSPAGDEEEVKEIDDGNNSIEDSTWTELKLINSTEIPPEYLLSKEKPLVSARCGHRKQLKSNPEGGRALRVTNIAKRHETLENTWKAITEGGGGCIQVRKQDAWGPLEMKKPATFKERTHQPPVSKLRKEPSLSQDELNRRAEAFIRNFNQQMRLQKQESLNQYMQMINRDAN